MTVDFVGKKNKQINAHLVHAASSNVFHEIAS